MATQAENQARLDALEAAIAQGALRVSFPDGRSVDYRTLDEMERIAGDLRRKIAAAGTTTPVNRINFYAAKGL